jgi:CRP-like cAMP-binding protein
MDRRYGRYQLLHGLATGGMAEVFVARTCGLTGFEKTVVLKRVRSDLSRDSQFTSLFLDEARLCMRMSHANVVQVFDFGRVHDSYYMAMEHVDGCDLDRLLGLYPNGMPPGLAAYILRETLRGLEYAHRLQDPEGKRLCIVHRDVSPGNILLGWDGSVKIGDFGVASARTGETRLARDIVVGKPEYMSPEQASGREAEPVSDVFAAGLVLWHALVGRCAYGENIDAARAGRVPLAHEVNPKIPIALSAIVERATQVAAGRRFQSARNFGQELHAFLVEHYPATGPFELQDTLERHQPVLTGEDDRNQRASVGALPEAVYPLATAFASGPDLHLLTDMGDVCAAAQDAASAVAFWRAAGVCFARAGMLAEALGRARAILEHVSFGQVGQELGDWFDAWTAPPERVSAMITHGASASEKLAQRLLGGNIETGSGNRATLLAQMGKQAFVDLARLAPWHVVAAGDSIIVEGQAGRSMFLLCRGRVRVHARNADGVDVTLSSLASGDMFGEHSFFTNLPRIAGVQATVHTEVIEIPPPLYERVMAANPAASAILLNLYKDRIVDTVVATSRALGTLDAALRRRLIEQFTLVEVDAGAWIAREGEPADAVYLVKSGIADVLRGEARIATLEPGTLFGEIGVLRATPRRASVRAASRMEVLRLPAQDFLDILRDAPDVRTGVQAQMRRRELEGQAGGVLEKLLS